MMPEIPSRRDALPPPGVGGGARDKSLTCRIPALSRLCVFFLMKMGVFAFVCEMDTFLSAMYWMCVGRYLHILSDYVAYRGITISPARRRGCFVLVLVLVLLESRLSPSHADKTRTRVEGLFFF